MREKEAKEKICPLITDNQGFYEKVPVKCITTGCMAWEEASWLDDTSDGDCKLIRKEK